MMIPHKKLNSILSNCSFVLVFVVISTILGWIYGYYANIRELEWFNNLSREERFCGNYLFWTAELGAIVGSQFGFIVGLIVISLVQVFARKENFLSSFEKKKA